MAQNLNQFPQNPNLADVLNFFKKQIKLEMNCLHIGTIKSFDSSNQTADVSINYPKTLSQSTSVGSVTLQNVDYPLLSQCPVFVLGGGSGCITMPIAAGDECLVFFNDRDMSNWWGTGSTSTAPNTPRLHGFSDALVLVGINSVPNVWLNYDDSAVTMRYGANNTLKINTSSIEGNINGNTLTLQASKLLVSLTTGVSLELDATGKLKITNASGEFVAQLVTLFTDIQNALVNTLLGPQPLIMATFPTDLAVLETFKS